jgi:hypothetical protein
MASPAIYPISQEQLSILGRLNLKPNDLIFKTSCRRQRIA